jgi:hypothetical protein
MDITPQLNVYGKFTFRVPFITPEDEYKCELVEPISLLIKQGVNVYNKYYSINKLSQEVFRLDVKDNINIITLVSNKNIIYIPSSFIVSVPTAYAVQYARFIFTIDLGELPNKLDLVDLQTNLQLLSQDITGRPVNIRLNRLLSKNVIGVAEHNRRETKRKLLIKQKVSPVKTIKKQLTDIRALRKHILLLEEEIINLHNIAITP